MTTLREAVRRRIVELVPDAETQRHTWPEADGSLGYAETDKPIQLHDVLRAVSRSIGDKQYILEESPEDMALLQVGNWDYDGFSSSLKDRVLLNLAVDADGQTDEVWQWLAEVLGVPA